MKAKILVVEDESVFRDLANPVLTKQGYSVDIAEKAAEALEKMKRRR